MGKVKENLINQLDDKVTSILWDGQYMIEDLMHETRLAVLNGDDYFAQEVLAEKVNNCFEDIYSRLMEELQKWQDTLVSRMLSK